MKAPVSVCIISRDDPHLEQCIKSFQDYVEEICVAITSDTDKATEEVCQRLGVKYEVFTDCNKDDKIIDFSMARNKSISLATQPWICWIDSDDVVVGMENLSKLCATFNTQRKDLDAVCFLFPYEYSYDSNGNITCRQFRERLAYGKDNFQFIGAVHEVLVPKTGVRSQQIQNEDITFKHQRQYNPKPQDPGRNLRILQNYFNNGGNDPRHMYYIGLEYSNHGDWPNAIKYLTEYVGKSGWNDEKAMAYMKLVDISQLTGKFQEGLDYAFELLKLKHNWHESYYALCRMYYLLGQWEQAVYYGKLALETPPTQTLLFVNTSDRFEIHNYLNVALNHIGDVAGAYQSVLDGLQGIPNHPQLLNNKPIYEKHLGIQVAQEEIIGDAIYPAIVFVTGIGPEPWSPETVKQTGIGGSEMMLINQAKNLAALGHKVVVYAACDGTFDNVEYRHFTKFKNINCDVLIVSRYTQFLGDDYNVTAKLKLLWIHDIMAIQATNELLLKADKILCLTNWHKDFFVKHHNVHPEQVIVTRNGIDLTRFHKHLLSDIMNKEENIVVRNQYKCVNSSSPDRSWPVLLEIWPKIRAKVPQAELHLYYGFNNWKIMAAGNPLQMELIARLEEQIKVTEGVVYHDRVSQEELAREFLSAGVWLHPTWFTETSCITAMEARMAGLHIVTSKLAALLETVGSYQNATLIEGDWTNPIYQSQFIDAAITALNNPNHSSDGVMFGLLELAQNWHDMCNKLIKQKETNPINKYQPTPRYQNPQEKSKLVKLNIACGPNIFPYSGWINYDHADFNQYFNFIRTIQTDNGMPDHQKKLWNYVQQGGEIQYQQHNMTQPFTQHPDESVDYIYVGRAIEHLSPIHQMPAFLKECHRMLKPGGILRMTTPDLQLLIDAFNSSQMDKFDDDQPEYYKKACPSEKLSYLMFGAGGENCTQQNYEGHFNLFTKTSMDRALEKAGFSKTVYYQEAGQGLNEIAQEVRDEGLSHSLCVEAVK